MNVKVIVRSTVLAALAAACSPAQLKLAVQNLACSDLSDISVGTTPEVRLLVLYSENASLNTNDIESEIILAVEEMDLAFQSSGINARAVVAHMEKVSITDAGGETTLLSQLKAGTGGLERVTELRNAYHADVVGLIAEGINGKAFPMYVPTMNARDNAFFVAGRVAVGSTLTLAHEFGHLLGGVHQRPSPPPPDAPRYSYAFPMICLTCVVDGLTGWRTIMATNTSPQTTRIERYSNPDLQFGGTPLGASGNDPEPRDMRKTFTNTAPLAAYFRYTPVWFASAGGAGPWFEKRVTDESMTALAFADFDGDRETDAFMIDQATSTWRISRGASDAWEVLRVDPEKTPLAELQFADFNGDGQADVFRSDVGQQTWFVSWSGTSDWQVLQGPAASLAVPVKDLAFGSFDGDAKADVFRVDVSSRTWLVSAGGASAWTLLGATDPMRTQPIAELQLGDFDGDGVTDVFRSDVPSATWYWSKGGTSSWQPLNGPADDLAVPVDELGFGDFDGDGAMDVLVLNALAWSVAWRGAGLLEFLKVSCLRRNDVRLGDFDGDRVTDVIRAGIRP